MEKEDYMKYDFFSGLFLLLLSIGICIMAYRLGLGNYNNPGSGFIAFGTAALLGLMSIGMVIRSLPGIVRVHQQKKVFQGIRWKILVFVLSTLVGYGIALNTLGFSVCTFLMMIFFFRVVGGKQWWLTLSLSIFITGAAYLIFMVWLGCEFPRGFWVSIIRI